MVLTNKYVIDEWRRGHQWILHPKGEEIYRPRPEAEVCKFVPPRDVKSIDDRADVRQCYSHVEYYMKKIREIELAICKYYT